MTVSLKKLVADVRVWDLEGFGLSFYILGLGFSSKHFRAKCLYFTG